MAFDWGYFFSLFSIGAFWQACVTVIVISTLSWGIGLVVGFLLACAKLSAPRWVKIPVELYIWFFRSVPLMHRSPCTSPIMPAIESSCNSTHGTSTNNHLPSHIALQPL